MSFRSSFDDYKLRYENTREGELYRENERLKEEKEQQEWRDRSASYEREQNEYRARTQRAREEENRREERWNIRENFRQKAEEIEHLKLCIKFGIEEVES